LGSYHETHGTVRPVPAKSIDGASASTVGSMFSDAGKPCVTHAPALNARTKICCDEPVFCSKVAHGTCRLPATTVPPWTSETPASWFGSMPFAMSSLTCEPSAGSPTKAAAAVPASASAAARARVVGKARRLKPFAGFGAGAWESEVGMVLPLGESRHRVAALGAESVTGPEAVSHRGRPPVFSRRRCRVSNQSGRRASRRDALGTAGGSILCR
jgi:hypothetical protein